MTLEDKIGQKVLELDFSGVVHILKGDNRQYLKAEA